jgi:hypothetical protein
MLKGVDSSNDDTILNDRKGYLAAKVPLVRFQKINQEILCRVLP